MRKRKRKLKKGIDQELFQRRIIFAHVVVIFVITAFTGRALYLQVVKGDYYRKKMNSQVDRTVKLSARRGEIVDRWENVMAISVKMPSIYGRPSEIKNKKEIAHILSKILKEDYREIIKKLSLPRPFVWIKRWVTPEEAEAVKREIPGKGVGVEWEYKRYYPNRFIAAHILGFAGVDREGLEGIEKQYDRYLSPTDVVISEKKDGKGKTMWVSSYKEEDIQLGLTIDRDVQAEVEKILKRYVEYYEAKNGIAGFINSKTGEIIALAVYPPFNPNTFWKFPSEVRRNRAFTDIYEPGSTFKVFLLSVALEEGVIDENDKFYCEEGRYFVYGKEIKDYRPFKELTAKDIIVFSSNIGAVKISERLDKRVFYDYLKKFGFGSKTGIDFPGETQGLLKYYKKWTPFEYKTIAFGQGVGVSAIQMLTAFSAVVNGGYVIKPYLVSYVRKNGKIVYKGKPVYYRKVISSKTSRRMKNILIEVVERGTGINAQIEGYYVGGKTGTSQKIDPVTHTYSEELYVSSFIGFAPLSAKYVGIVVIDEPKKEIYAGKVAAPAFAEMMRFILHRYKVPQERPIEVARGEE